MSTDRELLQAAAKAAGEVIRWADAPTSFNYSGFLRKTEHLYPSGFPIEVRWNPLTGDGDALRLAVKLGIKIEPFQSSSTAFATAPGGAYADEEYGCDPYAATRRAIVRAAAALGEQHDQ